MAEEVSSFSDFPEDVQLCILSFLSPAEIANFALTSKRFSPLCRDDSKLWHSLCDRRWGSKTQIHKWGDGKISYRLLHRTLSRWDHLIGFWRRCGQSRQRHISPPSLLFFEWGPSFVSGSRVSPASSRDSSSPSSSYGVSKAPFLFMTLGPDGQVVNYINPDGQDGKEDVDLIGVSVDFIGDTHFSVEENLSFAPARSGSGSGSPNSKVEEGEDTAAVESGSPGSLPGTSELYQYYANKTSPGAVRKQRRKDKERLGKRRWETEHFLKIMDSSPTPNRPLQGLWKGICDDMRLEFYLVAYDGAGISCRRVGDLAERFSSSMPVFWTSNPTFVESPFSAEEVSLYDGRAHIRPPEPASDLQLKCPSLDEEVVSRIMYINSSYDLVIPNLAETSAHPWRVEGRIWQYSDGTFGFGFLRDNFIVDLKHVAQDGHLLDTMMLGND
ncbi:hypothetical protein Tsubulata_042860 [Turnera subulata]|uniref:F-box protein n=1 Tax=Turnera subulata TaxID=218843 RepID=A0A9Q0J8M9_9ROSI|nr:hypothetical protein Tsubulata_042860 [Turnera subulata]